MAVGGATRHQLTGLVGGLQFPALVSLTVCWLGRFPSPAPSMARVRRRGAHPVAGQAQLAGGYPAPTMTTRYLLLFVLFVVSAFYSSCSEAFHELFLKNDIDHDDRHDDDQERSC